MHLQAFPSLAAIPVALAFTILASYALPWIGKALASSLAPRRQAPILPLPPGLNSTRNVQSALSSRLAEPIGSQAFVQHRALVVQLQPALC